MGKTLVARHIHALGPTAGRRLAVANLHTLSERDRRVMILGAGPPELAGTRKSLFEHPTTVLLKSIQETPAYLQDAVAGILAAGVVVRPGHGAALPVRARVILALERPAHVFLRSGEMTPALYGVIGKCTEVVIPPLRERPADLRSLLRHWSAPGRRAGRDGAGRRPPGALLRYPWPGNTAELRAHLRSVARLSHEEALQEHERREIARIVGMIEERHEFSLREALKSVEHHLVERAMRQAGGRRVEAARLLGLSERDLRRKVTSPL